MRRIFLISALSRFGVGLVLLIFCTGCETTGDPTRGGIFWSERKARQRQAALWQDLAMEGEQHDSAEKRGRQLRSQYAKKEHTLERIREDRVVLDEDLKLARKELESMGQADAHLREELSRLEVARAALDEDTGRSELQLRRELEALKTEVEQLRARNKVLQSAM